MAPMSRGHAGKPSKVVKPKASRKVTAHTKNHRFQPFSERIANLKIDPLRRRKDLIAADEPTEASATHLGRRLEEWKDLNLSQAFTSFSREVSLLCETLPMVLHNEDKIMDLLMEYIEKMDSLAMEPLMDLLSHFAHDLDARFEKHFSRAVATVTAVAAKHQDPAVIEWSFTCLAWLFKYLSRLLIPNLCPLYDLMAQYLGKGAQKPFIVRFASESLSFLIRKSALSYDRNNAPLDRIMGHMIADWQQSQTLRTADMYRQGLMTLLTESMKGVKPGFHSSAHAVLKSLLKCVSSSPQSSTQLVIGVLTSLIHHSNWETFRPLLLIVLSHIDLTLPNATAEELGMISHLLLTVACVRRGTRVSDWKQILLLLRTVSGTEMHSLLLTAESRAAILSALAQSMQAAPMDALWPNLAILESLRKDPWMQDFPQFCDLFSRLSMDGFTQFILPDLLGFISENWENNEETLLLLVTILKNRGLQTKFNAPKALSTTVQDRLGPLVEKAGSEAQLLGHLYAANILSNGLDMFRLDELTIGIVAKFLREIWDKRRAFLKVAAYQHFVSGPVLRHLLSLGHESLVRDEWASICEESARAGKVVQYWKNIKHCLSLGIQVKLDGKHLDILKQSMIDCLHLASHDIRVIVLEAMQLLWQRCAAAPSTALNTALQIETTPIRLDTARVISANVRRLASTFCDEDSAPWVQRAVATYCCGLLHLHLSQVWEDATQALSEICKLGLGESIVVPILAQWLEDPFATANENPISNSPILDGKSDGFRVVSDFECSHLKKITAISQQVFEDRNSGFLTAEERFRLDTVHMETGSVSARSQALRVFNKLPTIAEKHNRILVPFLLHSAAQDYQEESEELASKWLRKDQKALLSIFAQFQNPNMLFRSAEVHTRLLDLCANGDVEIQRSSLRAIFSWKQLSVVRYEERLLNLLDDSRFREELSVFLQSEGETESVRIEDEAELMPVLLRLLYGRAISDGKGAGRTKRKAIFTALARYGPKVLGVFIDIAISSAKPSTSQDEDEAHSNVTKLKQQIGLLNMLDDMLETVGPALEPYSETVLDVVLSITIGVSTVLANVERQPQSASTETAGTVIENGSLLKSVRQTGLQTLVRVFSTLNAARFQEQAKSVVDHLINPRLGTFASENTQAVSAILRLLSAWSSDSNTAVYLTRYQDGILDKVADLLREPNAKDQVKLFILNDILDNLLRIGPETRIVAPYASGFVRSISVLLQGQVAKDVLDASVRTITMLATHITDVQEAQDTLTLCASLLRKPVKTVPSYVKAGLLRTLMPLLGIPGIVATVELFESVAGLFSRLRGGNDRVLVAAVQTKLSEGNLQQLEAARICEDLNSLSGRLDEPDHERRLRGFDVIYQRGASFSPPQWLPIIHNCLFLIRDADELVNRQSASKALECYVSSAQGKQDYLPLVSTILAALQRDMQASSELVRAESLNVIHHLIEHLPTWPPVADMVSLIVSGDQEASFFTNILHIQQHRRLRALRRLSEEAPKLASSNIVNFFLPLLEHFVFDGREGDADRVLGDQTIQTLAHLARSMSWSAYCTAVRRYLGRMKQDEHEKAVLRLLGVMADGLLSCTGRNAESEEARIAAPYEQDTVLPSLRASSNPAETKLTRTLPEREAFVREVTVSMLPPLLGYLHQKDESTVDRRVPVAVTVVKLLRSLPDDEHFAFRVAPALTDLCQILRSRSQEARDQTRRTLSIIAKLIGPTYFGFLVKDMRSALQRGYQMHVLSFTLHSLLVDCAFQPGDIDYCMPELVAIVMDDIFGVTGQEKDAEEYKSGMKEIKSNKSFDTMELLAKQVSISQAVNLIQPIQMLLLEALDSRALKKIDDLLSRIGRGFEHNPTANDQDLLVLCYQLARRASSSTSGAQVTKKSTVTLERDKRYLVAPERKLNGRAAFTTSFSFKLVGFALNVVRKIIRRHETLLTPANMSGFLPMAGDALVDGYEEVKIAAMKFLTAVVRIPLPDLDSNAAVYAKEAVAVIAGAVSTTTDAAKAALDLLTAILRDRRQATIRTRDLTLVLKALKADIDEPDRQNITYRFLRSVLGRKIDATEVYEIMDDVGKAMITNPDNQVRESARSAFSQFVIDYPQAKKRWQKQINFLIQNLEYEHRSGRQSVMEMFHQLITKLSDEVLEPLILPLFVPLMLRLVNDDDTACREMAGLLIGKLFERSQQETTNQMLGAMRKWLTDASKPVTVLAALQAWQIYISKGLSGSKENELVTSALSSVLKNCSDDGDSDSSRLLPSALETLAALCEKAPKTAFASTFAELWEMVQQCILHDDGAVREQAAGLIGQLCSDFASASSRSEQGLAAMPMRGSQGLELTAHDMQRMTVAALRALSGSGDNESEKFLAQIVRNIIFLGRCFNSNAMSWRGERAEVSADEESDSSETDAKTTVRAFQYLLTRLSRVIRREGTAVASRTAALQCQAALISLTSSIPDLQTILQPLYVLTDPSIPQPPGEGHQQLTDKARGLLELIQKKMDNHAYVAALGEARRAVKARRETRRQKRRIEAVSAPDKWAKEKKRKYEVKKARQKVKSAESRGKRRGW